MFQYVSYFCTVRSDLSPSSFISKAVSVNKSFRYSFLKNVWLCLYCTALWCLSFAFLFISFYLIQFTSFYARQLKNFVSIPTKTIILFFFLQTSKKVSGPLEFYKLLGTGRNFFLKCGLDPNMNNHCHTLAMIKICVFERLFLPSILLCVIPD
jgi:hypothetical protein